MVVSVNLMAMNAQRQFGLVGNAKNKTMEKLSSGYKVNRAADDAAGLAISEKMRRQIRGLTQASMNATDGISMVQTAEGGLNEVHDMIHRMNELSVKAANGTLSKEDREYANQEYLELKKEINRVADSTTFNEIQLFPPDGSSVYSASYDIRFNGDGTCSVQMYNDSYSIGETNATDNAKETANYIKDTLFGEIMPTLQNKLSSLAGKEDLTLKLDLSYIDGPNGTLALAGYSYYVGSYNPVNDSFYVKIDTADFTDSNSLVGKNRNDLLKATLAHELTHTLMQYHLTKQMATEFPTWFKEGAAQMGGGGFSTGWLWELSYITEGMTEQSDSSKDAEIANYLRKYTTDGRPYGHGYLATAYASYLASGSPPSIDLLAEGLNKILGEIKSGKNFEEVVKDTTGMSVNEITTAINSGDQKATEFVRKLSIATGEGAGSALFGLSQGTQRLGTIPADGSTVSNIVSADNLFLQVGAEAGQHIDVPLFSIGTKTLGLHDTNILDAEQAGKAIEAAKNAIQVVSSIRSVYGAIQNRLEHTINNLNNVVENTTASESAIRDTDMAKEMVQLSMQNILEQAGYAMMSQANQSKQGILTLLQ